MKRTTIAAAAALLGLGGCQGPGFGERDQYVVHTPLYADNRVFFLGNNVDDKGRIGLVHPTAIANPPPQARMVHGKPLSVILSTVSLPKETTGLTGTSDIAVIIDLASASDGSGRSVVAWYQRGVRPDQNLNFSNLLLFHEAAWDDRVAPLVRIRVMDVTAERNLEIRSVLAEVSKFQGLVGAAIPNPIVNPVFEVATKAASLILASRPNRMLLDYTAQFYSADQIATSFGSDLTPLRKGRFVLIGRKDGDRSYWKRDFRFDPIELNVREEATSVGVPSPFVVVSISDIEAVIPSSVAARSAYLQKLLSDAQQTNFERVQEEASLLKNGVDALVVAEKLRRFRTRDDLDKVVKHLQLSAKELSAVDQAFLLSLVARVSGCLFTSPGAVATWWDKVKTSVSFKPGEFKLNNADCPA